MAPVVIGRTERLPQYLAGGDAGHNDHGANGDILEHHRHAFVLDILRHQLGLRAEVVEMKSWRHGHKQILTFLKSLCNRLSAGLRGITLSEHRQNKANTMIATRKAAETLEF